jgi:L-alanine-DL-glutamate epimerase-like enolase superfamily enzyme
MKVTHIGAALLSPFPWVLVKVTTDEGLVGIGEAYHGAGVHQIAVDQRLTQVLIGEDPRNVDKLFHDMMRRMSASGYYQGAVMSAISGIEMALWDITGQSAGVPIWQLLGGKFRDKIRIYNDCHAGDSKSIESWIEKAREVEARGFDAIKFDIDPLPDQRDRYSRGISNDHIAYYIDVVKAVREALEPNTDLLIDGHWKHSPTDILQVAKAYEDLNLFWLEDPIPPENIDAMARFTQSTTTPICTGENFYTAHGFRELIEKQAADIISPDLAKAGGLLAGRKIADLAELYYIPFCPHNICGPIGTMAATHVCAAVPNFQMLEFHHLDNEIWSGLLVEQNLIRDGHIDVTTKPGLGVTLDEDAARAISVDNLGFFEE